jgi:rhodanese-related sulfurtransferase
MKKLIYILPILLIVILSACGKETPEIENISAEEANKLIDNDEVIVLDVRTFEEFEQGHIPNATLLPLQELEGRLDELNKEETYLVVCRSGNRSAQASEILLNNGFSNIYNMTSGMNSWTYDIMK